MSAQPASLSCSAAPLVVVKLGGSHALSPLLKHWLGAIGRAVGGVVVVPGGGPFADAVRAAQAGMGFDDDAAHDMALMAMAQYACALASLAEGFVVATDLGAIRMARRQGRIPIWSPWPMLRAHPDIPRSWDVTSDSLAIWLAGALGADRVVLIKHRAAADDAGPHAMMRDGLVDTAFARFAAGFDGRVLLAGPNDLARADVLLGGRSATAT